MKFLNDREWKYYSRDVYRGTCFEYRLNNAQHTCHEIYSDAIKNIIKSMTRDRLLTICRLFEYKNWLQPLVCVIFDIFMNIFIQIESTW